MNKRNGLLNKITGILIITFIIIYFIPVPYLITAPGIAQELSPIITVKDGYKNNSRGDFLLTAVSSQQATAWDYIFFNLTKPENKKIEPLSKHLPEGISMAQYLEIMEKLMEDSKKKAQAVAFKKAGYEINLESRGAIIEEVLKNGTAQEKLKRGDIIIEVDGKRVLESQDAVDYIQKNEIGDTVNITVKRNDSKKEFTLKTIEMKNNPGKPSIGVMIYTDFSFEFPREVIFHTKNIAGPSAGGMFALEIYDQLKPGDITGGMRIAGTGTIDLDGNIGEIGGVEHKVIAAENNNADIFFCPEENYEKARETAINIDVISIKTIDDAIEFLEKNI